MNGHISVSLTVCCPEADVARVAETLSRVAAGISLDGCDAIMSLYRNEVDTDAEVD